MERTTSPSLAARGLSPQAVERSRQKHGSNALTKQGRSGFGKQLLSNFGDPIIKILLAALLLNLLFVFKEQNWFESVGIAIAISWPPSCPPCRNTAANRPSSACSRKPRLCGAG